MTSTVNIGCMHVARGPSRLVALLGSCVGVALYDPESRVGGLAHVMLPRCPCGDPRSARYGDTAVGALVTGLLKAGADRRRIRAKLAGGARLMFSRSDSRVGNVGDANIRVVTESLERMKIPIEGQDLGGTHGRKMTVDLKDFHVRVKRLNRSGEVLD